MSIIAYTIICTFQSCKQHASESRKKKEKKKKNTRAKKKENRDNKTMIYRGRMVAYVVIAKGYLKQCHPGRVIGTVEG